MISVGVKELKAKLSGYVEKVRNGEEFVITERGKEVALVIPISPERRALKALVDSGKAIWAGGKPVGVKGVKVRRGPISKSVLESRR
jgi:prevent-host-death family protein